MQEKIVEPTQILAESEVPGKSAWYVVGCRETLRVTLYAQQIRALNLAWALEASGRLSPNANVIVVGGGAAGLTVATALACCGAHVTVLEKEADVLPLQRNCYKRHLHPHIYDWPHKESLNTNAGLPLLNWRAGMARDVAGAIESQFEELTFQWGKKLTLLTEVENIELDMPAPGRVSFRTRGGSHRSRRTNLDYDLLIFAIGFGVEQTLWMGARGSYWADDSLDQGGVFQPGEYLVSGTGDGGLIDVLRIALRNFRQEDLARLVEWLPHFEELREDLLKLDETARASGPQEASLLFDRYAALSGKAVDELDELIRERHLNSRARVTLLCRGSSPFSLRAASLHRLLLSRLLFNFPHTLDVRARVDLQLQMLRPRDGKVGFAYGGESTFDHLIIRHGPKRALDAIPELDSLRALPPGTTRAVVKHFGDRFGKPRAIGWAGGATKADYLLALGELVSVVPGAELPSVRLDLFRDVVLEVRECKQREWEAGDVEESAGDKEANDVSAIGSTRYSQQLPGLAIRPYENRLSGVTTLIGRPGAGKSAYLKLAVLRALEAHLRDGDDLPVYVTRPLELDDSADAVIEAIVESSLRSVQVSSFTMAATEMQRALSRNKAVLFVDNVDDWLPEQFDRTLDWLVSSGCRAMFAGRRLPVASSAHRPIAHEYELVGISPGAASKYLQCHFPDRAVNGEGSIADVVARICELPSGHEWISSPFLLSRTARLFFTRGPALFDKGLSRITLYEALIEEGIERLPLDQRLSIRTELEKVAAEDLMRPSVRLTFPRGRFTASRRSMVMVTGLVSGGARLEFSHLSIEEFLASSTPLDLAALRAGLREDENGWQQHLEILAMAHAKSAGDLVSALADARQDDPGHRLLLLVLRTIAYGGPAVETFGKAHADEVVAQVASRLVMPSAHFGDVERMLMRAFERAAPYLRNARLNDVVLPVVGEPGAEAWIVAKLLGLTAGEEPPPGSIYWSTIFCQARLLLGLSPHDLVTKTAGGDMMTRLTALHALASSGVALGDIRSILNDRHSHLRQRFASTLHSQPRFSHRLIAMLADEDEWTRRYALRSQSSNIDRWNTPPRRKVLLAILSSSSETSLVKRAALDLLHRHEDDVDPLIALLPALMRQRSSNSSEDASLLGSLMIRLADDSRVGKMIDDFLASGRAWLCSAEALAKVCVASPLRLELLSERLKSERPHDVEIEAAAQFPALEPRLRELLERFRTDAKRWHSLWCVLNALPRNDTETRDTRLACLDPKYISDDVAHATHGRSAVRRAAILSFAGDANVLEALQSVLFGDDDGAIAAAMTLIGDDP